MNNLRTNLWLIVALMMISIPLSASKKNTTSGSTGENSKVVVGTTQEMQLDRTLDSQSIPEGGFAYYKISIIQDFYVKNNTLIFSVNTPTGFDLNDPDIYISTEFEKPSLTQNEWKCTSLGEEVCPVPGVFVELGDTFYIGVYCKDKCLYEITATYTETFTLQADTYTTQNLDKDSARMYRLIVPVDPSNKVDRITVNIDLDTTNTTAIHVYIAKGEEIIPSSGNSLHLWPTWFGYSAVFYKDSRREFCVNCTYTLLLETEVDTSYTLSFSLSSTVQELTQTHNFVRDVVKYGQVNCYTYNMKSEEDDLGIYLFVYTGDPELYVNPLTKPNKLDDYKFKSEGPFDENLIITKGDRARENAKTGIYYICVFGRYSSSYELLVGDYKDRDIHLGNGYTKTMDIEPHELLNFVYDVTNITSEDPIKIQFYLYSTIGNADLYIKYCQVKVNESGNEEECALELENTQNPNVGLIYSSLHTSPLDRIDIKHEGSMCNNTASQPYSCYYSVGVKGMGDTISHFQLTVYDQATTAVPLKEGVPINTIIRSNQEDYYMFSNTDENVTKIKIQLTSMSGDADLYISRTQPLCRCRDAERRSTMDINLPDTVEYNRDNVTNITGPFYVTIYGFTHASYSLIYTAHREHEGDNNTVPTTVIQLISGHSQKHRMSEGEEQTVFAFRLSFTQNTQKDIRIILTPEAGDFDFYVGSGFVPTSDTAQWESLGTHYLHIGVGDSDYKYDATYYILIKKRKSLIGGITPTQIHYAFNIKYVTGDASVLVEGVQENGHVNLNEYIYYKYLVTDSSSAIRVSVTPFTGDPNLLVSIDPFNQQPNITDFTYKSSLRGGDTIEVNTQDLKTQNSYCHESTDELLSNCAIFIAVYTKDHNSTYSIQVSSGRVDSAILLVDGLGQHGSFGKEDQFVSYYFKANRDSGSQISLTPKIGVVEVYVNLISNGMSKPVRDWTPPTPTKHDFMAKPKAHSRILSIPKKRLDECEGACMQYLRVYFSEESRVNMTAFFIIASTEFKQLLEGETLTDTIQENQYRYYRFHVGCDNCTFAVSLTPISSGDPDLYINKGIHNLPTQFQYDFKTQTYKGEYIQISEDDPFFDEGREVGNKGGKHWGIRGDYTLGVYGFNNVTYTIQASSNMSRLVNIYQGLSYTYTQKAKTKKHFAYYHTIDQPFRIVISMHNGKAELYATFIKDLSDENIFKIIPNQDTALWQTNNERDYISITPSDEHYGIDGYYLITVNIIREASFTITIVPESEADITFIKLGEPFRGQLMINGWQRYGFLLEHTGALKITTTVFDGSFDYYIGKSANVTEEDYAFKGTGNSMLTIDEDNLDIGENYYLGIYGEQGTVYTLLIALDESIVWIHEGIPQHYAMHGEGTQANFLYDVTYTDLASTPNQPKEFPVVSFTLNTQDPGFFPQVYVKFQETGKPSSNLTYPDQNHNNHKYTNFDPYLKNLYGSFPTKNGEKSMVFGVLAHFSEDTNPNQTGNFFFTASSSRLSTLILGEQIIGNLIQDKTIIYRIYELYIANEQFIEVILEPCSGYLTFSVTDEVISFTEIESQKSYTDTLIGGRLYLHLAAGEGKHYITVKSRFYSTSIKGEEGEHIYTARYNLLARAAANQPQKRAYTFQGSPKIDYNISDSGIIMLSWNPVIISSGSKSVPSAVYTVYYTDKIGSNLETMCGLHYQEVNKLSDYGYATNATLNPKLLFKDKKVHKKIFVNVVAYIPEINDVLLYDSMEIYYGASKNSHTGSRNKLIMFLSITVGVLGIVAIIFGCRLRATHLRLKYEMSDVRNMAQVTHSVELRKPSEKETYQNLMVADDD